MMWFARRSYFKLIQLILRTKSSKRWDSHWRNSSLVLGSGAWMLSMLISLTGKANNISDQAEGREILRLAVMQVYRGA